jgi:hypothetical protein
VTRVPGLLSEVQLAAKQGLDDPADLPEVKSQTQLAEEKHAASAREIFAEMGKNAPFPPVLADYGTLDTPDEQKAEAQSYKDQYQQKLDDARKAAANRQELLKNETDPNIRRRFEAMDKQTVQGAQDNIDREQRRIDGKEDPYTQTWWLSSLRGFVRDSASTAGDVVRYPGIIAELANESITGGKEKSGITQLVDSWKNDVLLKHLPGDKARAGNFAETLGSATGSMTSFLIGGALVKGLGMAEWMGPAILGGASEASSMVDDAEAHGATTAQKWLSLVAGTGLGLTEAIPLDRMFKNLNEATGGGVTKMLKGSLASSMEEFIQEFGQSFGEDLTAKYLAGYDPKRQLSVTDYFKAGAVGAVTGAGMHIATAGAGKVAEASHRATDAHEAAKATEAEQRFHEALKATQSKFDQLIAAPAASPGLTRSVAGGVTAPPAPRLKVVQESKADGEPGEPVVVARAMEPIEALGERYQQTVETPQFQEYFKGSAVVDEQGQPQPVYHGTATSFRSFDPATQGSVTETSDSREGFFFSSSPGRASAAAEDATFGGTEGAAQVMPVFLAIKNPLVVTEAQGDPAETAKIIRQAKEAGHDGVIFHRGERGGQDFVAFKPSQIKSIWNTSFDPHDDNIDAYSVPLRTGGEKLDIKPDDKGFVSVRAAALALQERQRAAYGQIAADDRTEASKEKIAQMLAGEVAFELLPVNRGKSAYGWYTVKFQRALNRMAKKFPEFASNAAFKEDDSPGLGRLKSRQNARDFFTALLAITSDGQKVATNFTLARDLYQAFRDTGRLPEDFSGGGTGNASMVINIDNINRLFDQWGPRKFHKFLLSTATVSEINAELRAKGEKTMSRLPAGMEMPRAALIFGPKLGAFYSNLMGSTGYLTMDRWWVRTFNRLRGDLMTEASRTGLDRVKQMVSETEQLNEPWNHMSDEAAVYWAGKYARAYELKGFQDGSELETAANTVWKAATKNLKEQPKNASDRAFMIATAKRVQEILASQGHDDLTIADIQALIWYYEKRLYGDIGARQSQDISYEEAAARAAGDSNAGPGAGAQGAVRSRTKAKAGGSQRAADARAGGRGGQAGQGTSPGEAQQLRRLAGLPQSSPGPNAAIVAAKQQYLARMGLPDRRQVFHAVADPERGARIAAAYDDMKHDPADPAVKQAFEQMIKETFEQYRQVLAMGLKIEVIREGQDNPYPQGPKQVLEDLQRGHLWFYPSKLGFGTLTKIEDHPSLALSPFWIDGHQMTGVDVFRVVHDIFGHGLEGVGFGSHGEENAWQSHVRMYSPLAARAMTTLTRGQNSWVNFGPYGKANRANPQKTVYADQKVGLLPDWVSTEGITDDIEPVEDTVEGYIEAGRPDRAVAVAAEQARAAFATIGAGSVSQGLSRPIWNVRGGNRAPRQGLPVIREADAEAARVLGEYGIAAPPVAELSPGSGATFEAAIQASKVGNPFGAAVYVYPTQDYDGMRLFLTEDSTAGFALKGDEIVSVFSLGKHRGVGFSPR